MVAQNIGNWGGKDLEKRDLSEISNRNPTDFGFLLCEMVRALGNLGKVGCQEEIGGKAHGNFPLLRSL
jgi:hypothetical protein